jgi:hypothetical protein
MAVYRPRSAQEHSRLRKRIGRDSSARHARRDSHPSHLNLAQIIDVTCIISILAASVRGVW